MAHYKIPGAVRSHICLYSQSGVHPTKADHGEDYMCRVDHPSLEQPIEKTTGKLPLIDLGWSPHVLEIDTSALVFNADCEIQCKIFGYFPKKLTVSWQKKEKN
ncbi:unnamed protein product, partial [Staurois parvus]